MITNQEITNLILPKFKKYRRIDYLLVSRYVEQNDIELIAELRKFQNEDKGFGKGLEADIRMPNSSVAATNVAIGILQDIRNEELKKPLIKDIVMYLENTYNSSTECWKIVPKEVDDYPHAVWWNYDQLDSFTYGNPNPEVVGFLYQYRQYLTKIDINHHITKVCDYILNTPSNKVSMHSLLSLLRFYTRVDKDVQNLTREKIQFLVDYETSFDPKDWDTYVLEPYKIAIINNSFLATKQDVLQINLDRLYQLIIKELPQVTWEWYQYDDVFNKVRDEWIGLITSDIIKALRINRKQ